MAKKLKLESFIYHFLRAAQEAGRRMMPEDLDKWSDLIGKLNFTYDNKCFYVDVIENGKNNCLAQVPVNEFQFYTKGDAPDAVNKQKEKGIISGTDVVKEYNHAKVVGIVNQIIKLTGMHLLEVEVNMQENTNRRYEAEEEFHDQWASTVDISKIDVRHISEAVTSPELRYIRQALGNLKGKKLLDVGCGLGEASVYFALEGAEVTAMDISQGMLDTAKNLAAANGVEINTHKSAAEETRLREDEKFDIIYAGNLLHHVNIEDTLALLSPHLADGGKMVTWDPLAYNPIINVYRLMAKNVRTEDEHPLKWSDIKSFRKYFDQVETKYFWLTSLLIFIFMAVIQRRNPNKERFWKTVVDESERWEKIYRPLEAIDRVLLALIPPLRLLTWNVVIIGTKNGAKSQSDT